MKAHSEVHEHDIVQLRRKVGGWPSGREGFVVAERGRLKLVEIEDEHGATLDFIAVPEADLKTVWSPPVRPSQVA